MNEATKALLTGGAISAVGTAVGGVLGFILGGVVGDDFHDSEQKDVSEKIGMLLGAAFGAGISGGIAAWRTEKRIASLNAAPATGTGGDTSVPDPLHPECTITFHCDLHGQHCTSTSSCGNRMALKAAQAQGV